MWYITDLCLGLKLKSLCPYLYSSRSWNDLCSWTKCGVEMSWLSKGMTGRRHQPPSPKLSFKLHDQSLMKLLSTICEWGYWIVLSRSSSLYSADADDSTEKFRCDIEMLTRYTWRDSLSQHIAKRFGERAVEMGVVPSRMRTEELNSNPFFSAGNETMKQHLNGDQKSSTSIW